MKLFLKTFFRENEENLYQQSINFACGQREKEKHQSPKVNNKCDLDPKI
jgi:hypothetical protein